MPRLLKQDWIMAYSNAIDPISEAPRQYNIWSAISVIGAILKRKVYITHGPYTIYPNQYVILTGPPGVGKGTALHSAYAFPEELNLVNTIEDRTNAEKIVKKLADGNPGIPMITSTGGLVCPVDSSSVLKAPELSVLLGASTWMLDLLCSCWDQGKFTYDTKNSGTSVIKGLCVSLIGGCVPDFIRKVNKDANATVSSGFTARCIFVYADEASKKLTWPGSLDSSIAGKEQKKLLLNDLSHIANLSGEMKVEPGALKKLDEWYKQLTYTAQDSDVMQYFKSRMKVHILKLAMIYSCSSNDSLTIKETDMSMAIYSMRDIQKSLDRAFRGVGDSEYAESMARIMAFMEKRGVAGATENQIFSHVIRDMSRMTMDISINNLLQVNFMVARVVGKERHFFLVKQNKSINGVIP